MKACISFTILLFTSFVPWTWAGHEDHAHHHGELIPPKEVKSAAGSACENKIHIQVNGLVCDFCARALEKVIGKREDVAGIDVNLDSSQVEIAMKPGKTIDDITLTQLIKDSGYNVVSINKGC